jgi:hypothetical protein
MKTVQLLQLPVRELTSVLLNMEAAECERHARNVLEQLNGPAFEVVMWSITQHLLPNHGEEQDHLLRFHEVIAKHFPSTNKKDDTLGKLTFLIYMIVYKRSDALINDLRIRSH